MKVSLTTTLLIFFTVLVIIESIFAGIFYLDIMGTDRLAQREYRALSICQELYVMLNSYTTVIRALSEARDNPDSPLMAANSEKEQFNFSRTVDINCKQMLSIGLDPGSVKTLRKCINRMMARHQDFDKALSTHDRADEAYKHFVVACAVSFGEAAKDIKQMHKLLASQAREQPIFGIQPEELLTIAAAVNLVYLLLFAVFVEFSISRPVSRLARDCDRIKQGLALEKTGFAGSEIGILQQSFQQMSQQILDNDKRRKGYIALMQTVQSDILRNCQERIQQLGEQSGFSEKAKARLQKTDSNIAALMRLLQTMTDLLGDNELLDANIQPVQTSTARLLQDAAASVESLLQSRRIKLEIEDPDYSIILDPALISRVLLNLLSNAIKYSADGGTVAVSVQPEEEMIRFNVIDHGPGISAQDKEKLFQRFGQVKAADGVQRSGTGLGLVICKDFVEAHGGKIGCESEVGSGSCFWFSIPSERTKAKSLTTKKVNNLVTRKRTRSIKTGFALTLLSFLSIQTLLFLQLQNKFSDSETRAGKFAFQKDEMTETQELLIQQAYLGKRLQIAAMELNLTEAKRCIPALQKLWERLSKFIDKQKKGTAIAQGLFEIKVLDARLLSLLTYGLTHVQEMMDNSSQLRNQIESAADSVIDGYFRVSNLQSSEFKASFDWSQKLRIEVLSLLAVAGIADLLVIIAGALAGLRTTRRILILKSKAEDFSRGQAIEVSLIGNDELSLLDQRLCTVASSIRQAEYQRQELMAIINHDLRTPLSSILGSLELISQGTFGAITESDRSTLTQTSEDLQILLSQINDLLLLEKIEAGSYVLQNQVLNLAELLPESVKSQSPLAAEKSLTISVKDSVSAISVNGDKDLLCRLFSSVLRNAFSASPAGGAVNVLLDRVEGAALITIQDSGPGIAPELLPFIFERFRFLDGRPLNGLGLPLAQRICQLHGASIGFKSAKPGSTIVEIRLLLVALLEKGV